MFPISNFIQLKLDSAINLVSKLDKKSVDPWMWNEWLIFICLFYLLIYFLFVCLFFCILQNQNGYVKSYEPCGPMTAEPSPPGLDASQM